MQPSITEIIKGVPQAARTLKSLIGNAKKDAEKKYLMKKKKKKNIFGVDK